MQSYYFAKAKKFYDNIYNNIWRKIMLQINPIDLYALHKNNATTSLTNNATASFSDTMKSTGSQSLDDIFQRAAQKYDVPVSLLKAIGKAESNFNANAVSCAGAQGVMQLMPATAKSLGVTDSFDAEQNIMGGAKYIKQMLDRYDGNVKLALAAYNAGSGNVEKYGGIPPFKETQNYVKKVMSYAGETLTAGSYTPNASNKITNNNTSLQNQIEQSILNFEELTQDDYVLFVESLKNDMTSSLLSSIMNTDYNHDDKDTLFNQSAMFQNYNYMLNNGALYQDISALKSQNVNGSLTSQNVNLLGKRFQTMYDVE